MESDDRDMSLERFLAGHAAFGPKPLYAPGTVVGDWKVLAFLGRGGSGEVYRVENVLLGTVGALKVLVRGDAKAKDRFRLEARLLSESACTAFPRLCAYGESVGRPYAMTELLEPIELPTEDKAVAKFVPHNCGGSTVWSREGQVAAAALQDLAQGTRGFGVSRSSAYTVKHIRKGPFLTIYH